MNSFSFPSPSGEEWARWLSKTEERDCQIYRLDPGRLISDWKREGEISEGYSGREVLELLQNAGDAAREACVKGQVHISLNPNGLVIGNTGAPFDFDGVKSLMTANLSPKRHKRRGVVGQKGLGFRSILNWTHSPLISSGELGLGFFDEHAGLMLARLEENPAVNEQVSKEREYANGLILPRLAFPKWIPDWANEQWPDGPSVANIAARIWKLRRAGFDTVVGMPFIAKDTYGEAHKQLAELRPEILIFVDSIATLIIESEEEETSVEWSSQRFGDTVSVTSSDELIGRWQVISETGTVPAKFADQEQASQSNFEITVAIPDGDTECTESCLFCYFPTDVDLPIGAVCHATLRLDDTRKHLTPSPTNRYIVEQLANCLANAAERVANSSSDDPWAACNLVFPKSQIANELRGLGFVDALQRQAAERAIVPGLNGGFFPSTKLKLVEGQSAAWLPARYFADIAATCSIQHLKICNFLGFEKLKTDELMSRLNDAGDLSLHERAEAIVGLLKARVPDNFLSSAMLIDQKGERVPSGLRVILEARENLPKIPDWAKIRFLHKDLRLKLQDKLEITEARELQQKLKAFGLVEYSLANLIAPVVAEANRYLGDEHKDLEQLLWPEALTFLIEVYRAYPSEQRPNFPSDVRPRLLSQSNDQVSPNDLYLSEGYGLPGKINQTLYGSWAPEKLIASPEQVGLPASGENSVDFLKWLGVAEWPRDIQLKEPEPEYVRFVAESLDYPAKFEDRNFRNADELPKSTILSGKTVDGLAKILQSAPHTAILSWVAHDSRFASWRHPSENWGKIAVLPAYCQNHRICKGRIASHVSWALSRTPWLPSTEGKKVTPAECLLGERAIESLFPRPSEPDAEELRRFELEGRMLSEAFRSAGVVAGLAHFTKDEIYRLLLEMPVRSSDGKAARGLYRWILDNDHILYGRTGEMHRKFQQDGAMWGTLKGTSGYHPINELRHADSDGLPVALLNLICLVDLPRRVGADKVERIFGIKSVERSGIRHTVKSRSKNPKSDRLADNFVSAKTYIKRLRQSQSTRAEYLSTFDQLNLCLCDELNISLSYEESESEYRASEWEWVIDNNTIFVRTDYDADPDLLADALGAALASVFRITDGDAFAKLIRCKESSRQKLLKKMCGDSLHDEIEIAQKSHVPGAIYKGPIEGPERKDSFANNQDAEDPRAPGSEAGKAVDDTGGSGKLGVPIVEPLQHEPADNHASRKITVKKTSSSRSNRGLRRVTDGDLCERKAMEFEENSSPRRYPLAVGHITGFEAPGVDILSFASEEDRERFREPETRNEDLVERFIEVKGRSNPSAKIELKGNELKKAQKERSRYYIYRVYKAEDEFMISVLQNPLDCEEAITDAVWVDLDKAESTERFSLRYVNPKPDRSMSEDSSEKDG